jgi:hypothetical protein
MVRRFSVFGFWFSVGDAHPNSLNLNIRTRSQAPAWERVFLAKLCFANQTKQSLVTHLWFSKLEPGNQREKALLTTDYWLLATVSRLHPMAQRLPQGLLSGASGNLAGRLTDNFQEPDQGKAENPVFIEVGAT